MPIGFKPESHLPDQQNLAIRSDNLEDAWKETMDGLLSFRREKGRVPPSTGVTKPSGRSEVKTLGDVLDAVDSWSREHKKRKGGFAMDANDTHPSDSYRQRRYDFISKEEGVRKLAYDDKTGQPVRRGDPVQGLVTVGVGFNMERPDAKDVFVEATGLSDMSFEDVKNGEQRLTAEQVRSLFDYNIREAESIVHNKFKDADITEHQRLALVSLAYNNPSLIGPNLTQQVREGKWDKARDEILYRSNRDKVKGLANRRFREASMFAGPANAKRELPDYSEYMKEVLSTG